MSTLVISLDFEMFWGVAESRTISEYGRNVEGVWEAIPKILSMFQKYDVRATWATVGMLMCRNHAEWREIRPTSYPGYIQPGYSTYELDSMAKDYPNLFFARPLIEKILTIDGQEVASHTYSHFYCGAEGATPAQFAADLQCARHIAAEIGVTMRSIVFPRNQVLKDFVSEISSIGIDTYRGNPEHRLYRNGHFVPGGIVGRALRYLDSWVPLTGNHNARVIKDDGLLNVPASLFLRPCPSNESLLERRRLRRILQSMSNAAENDRICHIWWHPHNFGIETHKNLAFLEKILEHYRYLRDRYGMCSASMGDLSILS